MKKHVDNAVAALDRPVDITEHMLAGLVPSGVAVISPNKPKRQ